MLKQQDSVLKLLADKIDDFYLVGGTALSRYYFQHRISEDLDFFTQEYRPQRVREIISYLSETLNKEIELKVERTGKTSQVKIAVYYIPEGKGGLKIDFVEDYLKPSQPCKKIDGVFVLSLPDIYLHKVYTLTGSTANINLIGRRISTGRQEAKDFYDLYFLSHTFIPLSKFVWENCNSAHQEALIYWYRTYDRMNIKTGLLDLKVTSEKTADFREIDGHFKKEIDKLIEKEIGKI